MIRSLFAALFLCVALVAQSPIEILGKYMPSLVTSPIVATNVLPGGTLTNVHQSGAIVALSIVDGFPVATLIDHEAAFGDPVQTLTTTYTDRNGVTHTISTPIIGQTPAALQRAQTQHLAMVQWMQQQFPPKAP